MWFRFGMEVRFVAVTLNVAEYLRKLKKSSVRALNSPFLHVNKRVSCPLGKPRVYRGFVGSHLCHEDLGPSEPKISLPTWEHVVFYCKQRSFIGGRMGRERTDDWIFGLRVGRAGKRTDDVDARQREVALFPGAWIKWKEDMLPNKDQIHALCFGSP